MCHERGEESGPGVTPPSLRCHLPKLLLPLLPPEPLLPVFPGGRMKRNEESPLPQKWRRVWRGEYGVIVARFRGSDYFWILGNGRAKVGDGFGDVCLRDVERGVLSRKAWTCSWV
ncbi:hypothetical protein HPP92_010649 [Vanilla planifolia]|uniref:Uncharacterized protein n=1 Tax=Vanilla planifolia TaxID=51239 RepID=A0A835QZ11_VANPL|nr:hypothetical protein HPP92_010649 [Vanilla planifolia]